MIGLAALASFTLLAAPGAPPADVEGQAKAAFERALFDPFSAHIEPIGSLAYGKFELWPYGRTYTGWAACYRVNARNQLGGYTGWHVVAFTFDRAGVLERAVDEQENRPAALLMADACAAKGASGGT